MRSRAALVAIAVLGLLLAIAVHRACVGRVHPPAPAASHLTVAAAADLQHAFTQIAPLFEHQTGARITFVFGATGLLTRQAAAGAPFDALFAADTAHMADLERDGKLLPGTRAVYATGRLAVWTRRGGLLPRALPDLAQPAYRRIAVANPEHAPYGAAAVEALRRAGVWPAVRPRLVYGENVLEALQYASTGNATVAMVAMSLAVGSGGRYVPVPASLHAPIRQAGAVLRQTRQPALARQFVEFVAGPQGRAVLARCGFEPPGGP